MDFPFWEKTSTETTGLTKVDLQSHTKSTNRSIETAVCKSDVEHRKDPVGQVSDWQKRPAAAATMGEGRDVLGVASFSALQQCSCTVRGRFFALPDSSAVVEEEEVGLGTIPPDSIVGSRPGGEGQRWRALQIHLDSLRIHKPSYM